MSIDAQLLHSLNSRIKIITAEAIEEEKRIDKERNDAIMKRRGEVSKMRIENFSKNEIKKQKKTSKLLKDLFAICELEETPAFVSALGKILDNYQGKNNDIFLPLWTLRKFFCIDRSRYCSILTPFHFIFILRGDQRDTRERQKYLRSGSRKFRPNSKYP